MSYHVVGQSTPRIDNTGKVTGDAHYTSDVLLPGTLWAKCLRSSHPHARIVRLNTARAEKSPGVRAVLTGNDVRGILYGRRYRDISVLAQDTVRFMGERVAAIAADTLEQAEQALELIEVHYEALPAGFDPVAAAQEGSPLVHSNVNSYKGLPKQFDKPTNAFVQDVSIRGDINKGFAQTDVIVENTYTVPRVHQAFLEPHCCLVWIDEHERIQMWSPCKVPQGLKSSMAAAFDLPKGKIRVNPVAIGGDFGGKGAPIDQPICYLLGLRPGRPVKMVMEYREEVIAGAPRHAAIMRLKTGVKRAGTIVAHEMEAYLDAGAYGGFRPRAGIGGVRPARGRYSREHNRLSASPPYTQKISGGGRRAAREPQGPVAAEVALE